MDNHCIRVVCMFIIILATYGMIVSYKGVVEGYKGFKAPSITKSAQKQEQAVKKEEKKQEQILKKEEKKVEQAVKKQEQAIQKQVKKQEQAVQKQVKTAKKQGLKVKKQVKKVHKGVKKVTKAARKNHTLQPSEGSCSIVKKPANAYNFDARCKNTQYLNNVELLKGNQISFKCCDRALPANNLVVNKDSLHTKNSDFQLSCDGNSDITQFGSTEYAGNKLKHAITCRQNVNSVIPTLKSDCKTMKKPAKNMKIQCPAGRSIQNIQLLKKKNKMYYQYKCCVPYSFF